MRDIEQAAAKGLESLIDECAGDDRVAGILRDAWQKLQGRPCKPHWWKMPEVGDNVLVCEECWRSMEFGTIPGDVRASIINGFERRHGVEAGRAFEDAYNAAEKHLFPPVTVRHDPPARLLPTRKRKSLSELMKGLGVRENPPARLLPTRKRKSLSELMKDRVRQS